jgi:hypothetical protein
MNSNEQAIAETKKTFPDLKVTVGPALDNTNGGTNPKKIADIKKILSKIKMPLPAQNLG